MNCVDPGAESVDPVAGGSAAAEPSPDPSSDSRDASPIPLEPFVHQVGGHFPMVCLDEDVVCKPLNEREHRFYRTLAPELRPYAPGYEGTMKVEASEDSEGYITLKGRPPLAYLKDRASLDASGGSAASLGAAPRPPQPHYRLKRRDSIEMEHFSTSLVTSPSSLIR